MINVFIHNSVIMEKYMTTDYVSAIIPCAGCGSRMNVEGNKNHLPVNNLPILAHTLKAFDRVSMLDEIIIVYREGERELTEEVVSLAKIDKPYKLVVGGDYRQTSVYNGLKSVDARCSVVVVHDGARPLITTELIEKTIVEAKRVGAVSLAVRAKETYAFSEDNAISEAIDRSKLYAVQTPQTFSYDVLSRAYAKAIEDNFLESATDDTTLVKRSGGRVELVEGSYSNIKITTPEDLVLANIILSERENSDKD